MSETTDATAAFPAAAGLAICEAVRQQAARLGLEIGDEPRWAEAAFSTEADPYSGEISQVATWRGKSRYGKATLFADGRVFAEYQILLPHPRQPDCYVEAVQIWGRPGALKGEAVVAEYLK